MQQYHLVAAVVGVVLIHCSAASSMHAKKVNYYGDIVFVAGDTGYQKSTRYQAITCTKDMNRNFVLQWIQSRVGKDGDWARCDVGTRGSTTREYDASARVSWRAPASSPWIGEEDLMFYSAGEVMGKAGVDLEVVTFSDFEVLRYDAGGFFETHADRERAKGHIGTLLVVASSDDLQGGLLVDEAGRPVWERQEDPYIVFVPLGVLHGVTLVTKGARYAAKASVHGIIRTPAEVASRNEALRYSKLRED
jgi:hypothetical protein